MSSLLGTTFSSEPMNEVAKHTAETRLVQLNDEVTLRANEATTSGEGVKIGFKRKATEDEVVPIDGRAVMKELLADPKKKLSIGEARALMNEYAPASEDGTKWVLVRSSA